MNVRGLGGASDMVGRLAKRVGLRPRTGARHTVVEYILQLPRYLRLLGGLLVDPRVSGLDKLLVAAALAYILNPFDFIPESIPFLGQVDDVYLLGLALQRLMSNAGRRVVMSHWGGDPTDLSPAKLQSVISSALFFLPRGIGGKLRTLAGARPAVDDAPVRRRKRRKTTRATRAAAPAR